MEVSLKITGILLILLALIHIVFPSYFNWKHELSSLSLLNRQIMLVHTFFIALIVLLMGILCVVASRDLIETSLGKKVVLGLAVFWICRFFIQFFGYSSKLWRGKNFETTVHVIFSILWTYVSAVFILAYLA
jgi:hypothetical protein